MGVSSSSQTGKRVVDAKLDSASKTGVLNLANQSLKGMSSVWPKLGSSELVSKLKTLDLSGNAVKSIPVEVFALVNLKTLIISKCNLHRTYDLTTLLKLTNLKLDSNDLESDKIGGLPQSLHKINLSANHLTVLPPAVQSLSNLVTLELNHNRLVSIPGIGQLVSLVDLYLDDNALTELPDEIHLLVRLRKISVKRNKLSASRPANSERTSDVEVKYQCIPALFLQNTQVDSLELEGNVSLTKADVLSFQGVDAFFERRKQIKDKNLSGGALMDYALFGLN